MKSIVKKLLKLVKLLLHLLVTNIVLCLIIFVLYYYLTLNFLVSLIFVFMSVLIFDYYYSFKHILKKDMEINFQINYFLKIISISCLTNNYNIVESMEDGIEYLSGSFKEDVEDLINKIKVNYNYKDEFNNFMKKYPKKKILHKTFNTLLIIQQQSNINNTAKLSLKEISVSSQSYIDQVDKYNKVSISNIQNYFITLMISFLVIILTRLSLNIYYTSWALSISGQVINVMFLLIINIVSFYLIKKNKEEGSFNG